MVECKEVLIKVHRMLNSGTLGNMMSNYSKQDIDDYIDETGILNTRG